MLTPVPPIPRHRRFRPRRKASKPFPIPLELVAAVYDAGTAIDLTFDRPISVSALIPGAFFVFDGPASTTYTGDGPPTVISPTRIVVPLVDLEPTGGPSVMLTIFTENGIVAADGSATFPGVTVLPLPYP